MQSLDNYRQHHEKMNDNKKCSTFGNDIEMTTNDQVAHDYRYVCTLGSALRCKQIVFLFKQTHVLIIEINYTWKHFEPYYQLIIVCIYRSFFYRYCLRGFYFGISAGKDSFCQNQPSLTSTQPGRVEAWSIKINYYFESCRILGSRLPSYKLQSLARQKS